MFKQYLLPICVVAMLSLGQIGFKTLGMRINSSSDLLSPNNIFILLFVLSIYGIATILWIYVLSYASLSHAFMFYALTFVFIPVLANFLFNEKIGPWQILGAGLIILGVLASTRSGPN